MKLFNGIITNNLSNKHWFLILLIGLLGISLIYNVQLAPTLSRQGILENRIHQILTELRKLKQYQIYNQQSENQTNQIENQLLEIEQVLPAIWEIGKITAFVLQTIDKSQLNLIRQVILPEIVYEHYAELVLHLEMIGNFDQLMLFIESINSASFLMNITKMEIKNTSLGSQTPTLQIQIDLSTYRRFIN